jgi:molybdopterin biosynthesis enzyme
MAKFEKFDPREHIRGLAEAARQILAEELVSERQMPSFDQVVAAIDETRQKYRTRILAARQMEFDFD